MFSLDQVVPYGLQHNILSKMDFISFTRLRRSSKWLSNYNEKNRENIPVRNTISKFIYVCCHNELKIVVNEIYHAGPKNRRDVDSKRRLLDCVSISRKDMIGMDLISLDLEHLNGEELHNFVSFLVKYKIRTEKLSLIVGMSQESLFYILDHYTLFEELFLQKDRFESFSLHPRMRTLKRFHNYYPQPSPSISFISKKTEAAMLFLDGIFPFGELGDLILKICKREIRPKFVKVDGRQVTKEMLQEFLEKLKTDFGMTITWTAETMETNKIILPKDKYWYAEYGYQLYQITSPSVVIGLIAVKYSVGVRIVLRTCKNERKWLNIARRDAYLTNYMKWTLEYD